MTKIYTLIATLLLSFAVSAAEYTEGKQYQLLKTTASAKPKVTEYFSFYCSHCYGFEPVIDQVKASLPDGVTFNKAHASFMGGNMGVSMAKAYATMIVLKVEDKMIPVMFRQLHELRQAPKSDQELRQIFIDHGVDAKKFDAAFNGFAIDSMQKRFDKEFANAGLQAVPSVVVNNQYLLTPDSSIKSVDDYLALINYLLKK